MTKATPPPRPRSCSRSRVVVSLFMIAPMLLSVMAGLVNNYSTGLKSGLTLRWLGEVWENYGGTVGWSLALAAACVARHRAARRALRLCAGAQPLARAHLRGAADAAGRGAGPGDRARADPRLRPAHGLPPELRLHPRGPRDLHAALHGAHRELGRSSATSLLALEEGRRARSARASVSASWASSVPAVFPAIVAGSLMVFTLSVGEFNLTWMLHTPLTRTPARGPGRQLCLDAHRDRLGLHAGLLRRRSCPCCGACSTSPNLMQKRHGT